jgi:hypothetical protein
VDVAFDYYDVPDELLSDDDSKNVIKAAGIDLFLAEGIAIDQGGWCCMDAKEKTVLDAMKKEGKPMRPGDIAIKAEMDKAEVSKIIDNLKKEGKLISPKRCFYEPV